MTYVIATNNAHKLGEMKTILENQNRRAVSLREAGIAVDPEETGETFEENALIKARAACAAAHMPALADDSGLEVAALSGAPGVRSARYCEGSDADRTALLLRNLTGVPDRQRQAQFVSSIACVLPDGTEFTVRGVCPGRILQTPAGIGGFGYDPVFYVEEAGETFAQMAQELKNRISHRAEALRRMAGELDRRGL
ncbi:MAG: RdgB/HAM1 family non-canonical purine NTP pyrophosphatase [Clostridiaceae bacterium]|nr:RdgB/HAM1 family non-canonical purine NTP pyrophosphatase [Clostridiaceae bacterium]